MKSHAHPRRRPLIIALAAGLLAAAILTAAWPAVRRFAVASPEEVLVLYVREENSLGLKALPGLEEDKASCLDAEDGVLRIGGVVGSKTTLPAGTRAVVVRETYVTGYLIESRAVHVTKLPYCVAGRPGDPGGLDAFSCVGPESTLLAAAAMIKEAEGEAGAWPAVSVQVLEMPEVVVAPGGEWRVAAVREQGTTALLLPSEADYEARIRRAFEAGEPVSVLCVRNLGLWDTDRIDLGGSSGG